MSLYHKYRPKTFDEVVGQTEVVKVLKRYCEDGSLPHAIMISGPTGTGKTTLARILTTELGCQEHNVIEVKCAVVDSPIALIRSIDDTIHHRLNSNQLWIFNEIQAWSKSGFAQQGMLEFLEDVPEHVYFVMTTTDDKKVIPAVRNRCTRLQLKPLTDKDLKTLLTRTYSMESITANHKVIDKIIELAQGSPRQALVLLDAVIGESTEADQLACLQNPETESVAFDLVKLILPWKGSPASWKEVATLLEKLENVDSEEIRRTVLKAAKTMLLKTGSSLAYCAVQAFRDHSYDAGHAAIVAACYEIVRPGKK